MKLEPQILISRKSLNSSPIEVLKDYGPIEQSYSLDGPQFATKPVAFVWHLFQVKWCSGKEFIVGAFLSC